MQKITIVKFKNKIMKLKELKEMRKLGCKLADKIIKSGNPSVELKPKKMDRLRKLAKKYRKMVGEFCCD